ncbi:MAG: hypothetical protein P8I93_04295 [Crocinitomicaceae bacterium]|nr:hypothetical protein [Crocinitomicaceae bacterium]
MRLLFVFVFLLGLVSCSNYTHTGKQVYYYKSNGQIKEETSYKNGKLDGVSKSWYKNGQLKDECLWKDNKIMIYAKSWYVNGQMKSEKTFDKEKNETSITEWNEDGTYKEGYPKVESGNEVF